MGNYLGKGASRDRNNNDLIANDCQTQLGVTFCVLPKTSKITIFGTFVPRVISVFVIIKNQLKLQIISNLLYFLLTYLLNTL